LLLTTAVRIRENVCNSFGKTLKVTFLYSEKNVNVSTIWIPLDQLSLLKYFGNIILEIKKESTFLNVGCEFPLNRNSYLGYTWYLKTLAGKTRNFADSGYSDYYGAVILII